MENKTLSNFNINNLFAEFVVNKFEKSDLSQIEIVDCTNFFIIKGKTTSKEVLELSKVKLEFSEFFSSKNYQIQIGNTIDLIEYDVELKTPENLKMTFYNTHNLSQPSCVDEKISLTSKSEFPYGYSLDMGKSRYFYAKKLAYNLQSKYQWDKVTFDFPIPFDENDFSVFVDNCTTPDESVKSSILDAFDFNLTGFNKKLITLDWSKPLLDETYEFEFLKELNKNLIII